MSTDYQKTLELIRAWVAENPGPWDIWYLRYGVERQAPDGQAGNSTSEVFMQRSLRAVNQLIDEGALVKQGERNDAIYMAPEVHQQRQDDAKAAGERMARHREDWHQAKMRLAALGLGVQDEGGTLSIRLPLEGWHKILDRLEDTDGIPPGTAAWARDAGVSATEFMALPLDKRRKILDRFYERLHGEQS